MRPFSEYEVYIFDCDGVLLDSNYQKIIAMRRALESLEGLENGLESAMRYFADNFGRSRFHHVHIFLRDFLIFRNIHIPSNIEEEILANYSLFVEELYSEAPVTENVEAVLERLNGRLFVASGSEEKQLRNILLKNNLMKYFDGVYGSPSKKVDIIKYIVKTTNSNKSDVLMIGDSVPDFEAASENGIDFCGLYGYSNTADQLKERCVLAGCLKIKTWSDLKG